MTKIALRHSVPQQEGTQLIAPSGGAVSQQEELKQIMGTLHRSDRVQTLAYAFEVALEAGIQDKGPFNVPAAVARLSGGYIKLKGNAGQIDAQLKLIQGTIALLQKVCSTPELAQALSPAERVETLVYAFGHALLAGTQANGFYADKAVQSLRSGSLDLDGSPEQIKGKLSLIQAAATLIERACQYEVPFHRPPEAMNYLLPQKWRDEDKAERQRLWEEDVRQAVARIEAPEPRGNG